METVRNTQKQPQGTSRVRALGLLARAQRMWTSGANGARIWEPARTAAPRATAEDEGPAQEAPEESSPASEPGLAAIAQANSIKCAGNGSSTAVREESRLSEHLRTRGIKWIDVELFGCRAVQFGNVCRRKPDVLPRC